MIVAIVGSRNYYDYEYFKLMVDEFRLRNEITMIVSGGCRGVDEMAYSYAVNRGITFVCYPPKPEDGRSKFTKRNLRIAEHCEVMLALPMWDSRGTHDSIRLAEKLGKKVYVINV
jgi:hypothetical protein